MNDKKRVTIIVSAIVLFLLGYFNSQIGAFLINQQTLIGVLFSILFIQTVYCFWLKDRKSEYQRWYEREQREAEQYNEKYYAEREKNKELTKQLKQKNKRK